MDHYSSDDEVVILDFETTGLSTDYSRIIEVGAAIVKGDEIVETFSSLCNPGVELPPFITSLTGISTAMLDGQPSPEEVMEDFYSFMGERPILAHNASFDGRFLRAELGRIDYDFANPLLCTMLLSRRLILDSDGHKLGTLKRYLNYQEDDGHRDHRALDDVKVTACLWGHLRKLVEERIGQRGLGIHHFIQLSRMPKQRVEEHLARLALAEIS